MIRPCKEEELEKYRNEISGYLQIRNSGQKITNTLRLIDLIGVFFSFLLFTKGSNFKYKFGFVNKNGEKVGHDSREQKLIIFEMIFNDLPQSLSLEQYVRIQTLFIAILNTKGIDLEDKVYLLSFFDRRYAETEKLLITEVKEEFAEESVFLRVNAINQSLCKSEVYDQIEVIDSMYNVYENYIRLYLWNCIYRNKFLDGLIFIKKLIQKFDEIKDSIEIGLNEIIYRLLYNLISHNNLFQLESKSDIKEFVDEYMSLLDEDKKEILVRGLNFNPNNFVLGEYTIWSQTDFTDLEDKITDTYISFIVHSNSNVKEGISQNNRTFFRVKKVQNLIDDLIFTILYNTKQTMDCMPTAFFSDSISCIHDSYQVVLNVKYFFHPHFEIKEGKLNHKKFELEKAKRGGIYHPIKDFVIEELLNLFDANQFPFEIEKKDINSNLISSYLIDYFVVDQRIHHEVYTITNVNSYFNSREKYFENINKLQLYSNTDFKSFFENTEIVNGKQFFNFCISVINETVKHAIELGGLHKNMWTEGSEVKPIKEVQAQQILYSVLRNILQMKGISLSREVVAANGSVDFYLHYARDNTSFHICIELKNAHHEKINEANYTQLTKYIDDIGYKYGIFLVLWYKGDNWNYPSKYNSIEELKSTLDNNPTGNYDIENIIIDCAYHKVTPSKL